MGFGSRRSGDKPGHGQAGALGGFAKIGFAVPPAALGSQFETRAGGFGGEEKIAVRRKAGGGEALETSRLVLPPE